MNEYDSVDRWERIKKQAKRSGVVVTTHPQNALFVVHISENVRDDNTFLSLSEVQAFLNGLESSKKLS